MSFVTISQQVDGQMRSRTKSDLPGSRGSAGRCTIEVPHTDVLLVGFDHEKAVSEPLSDLLKNPESNGAEGMASDTQQMCSRHSESTVRFECRRP